MQFLRRRALSLGYRAENGGDKLLPELCGFPEVIGKAGWQNLGGRELDCGKVAGSVEGEEMEGRSLEDARLPEARRGTGNAGIQKCAAVDVVKSDTSDGRRAGVVDGTLSGRDRLVRGDIEQTASVMAGQLGLLGRIIPGYLHSSRFLCRDERVGDDRCVSRWNVSVRASLGCRTSFAFLTRVRRPWAADSREPGSRMGCRHSHALSLSLSLSLSRAIP